MRAWQLERQGPVESGVLRLAEVAPPRPAPDELLVRVEACAVCRTDLHVVEGDLELRRSPTIPGHQVVGEVADAGAEVRARIAGARLGERVGVAWVQRTCGTCRFCRSGRENLCEQAAFTGWSAAGGLAEWVTVPERFAYALPGARPAEELAPLLCAGIIGWRALRLAGALGPRAGGEPFRLGLHGFGAAGHLALQAARARGAELFVCTRDRERHQALARELGATWVGGAHDLPPRKLDAAILFAPAGELVVPALRALERGGRLVLGGIHLSDVPPLSYDLLYWERRIESVANNTREDGREFLAEALRGPIAARRECFPFEQADRALIALKRDAIRGAAVVTLRV